MTFPISAPHTARTVTLIATTGWSLFLESFWGIGLWCRVAYILLGTTVGVRHYLWRDLAAARHSYVLYNVRCFFRLRAPMSHKVLPVDLADAYTYTPGPCPDGSALPVNHVTVISAVFPTPGPGPCPERTKGSLLSKSTSMCSRWSCCFPLLGVLISTEDVFSASGYLGLAVFYSEGELSVAAAEKIKLSSMVHASRREECSGAVKLRASCEVARRDPRTVTKKGVYNAIPLKRSLLMSCHDVTIGAISLRGSYGIPSSGDTFWNVRSTDTLPSAAVQTLFARLTLT